MTTFRPAAAAAMAVLVGSTLMGCVPEPEPTEMMTPEIVWRDGKRPSSPLESHPAVKVLRAVLIGEAMAWNSGDFTIRQLTDHYKYLNLDGLVQFYSDQRDTPWVYPGPLPFEPVKVEGRPNRGFEVTACALPLPDWTISDRTVQWSTGPSGPTLQSWTVEDYYHDGRLVLVSSSGSFTPCDGSTVPVGLFDPQPAVPKGPVTPPKRTPLPDPKRTPYLGNQ